MTARIRAGEIISADIVMMLESAALINQKVCNIFAVDFAKKVESVMLIVSNDVTAKIAL